jgi:DNA sulfur modification protein DndD
MRVQILKWIYKGIRGVNNLEIDVQKSECNPYHTSLIMMPNGTGKTTTITLLRAIFDGTAENWDPTIIKGFDPKVNNTTKGSFTVQILIDEFVYWVELIFNYSRGTAHYRTSRSGQLGGLEDGHNLPEAVKFVFSRDFVKRFVFDGELAQQILSNKSDEAEKAIKFLYHINRLGEARAKVNRLVEEQQRKNTKTSIKTDNGVRKLENSVSSCQETLKNLKTKHNSYIERLEQHSERLTHLNQKISDSLKSDEQLSSLAEKLEKEKIYIQNEVKEKTLKVLDNFRNPNLLSPDIADRLTSLSDRMQQLKLPKTMSRQFFEELAHQKECICGRNITDKEKYTILNNAQDYLAEDQIGVINSIKSAVRDRKYNPSLSSEVKQLEELVKEKDRVVNDWDRLQLIREDSGDIELQMLRKDKAFLENEIEVLDQKIEFLASRDRLFIEKNRLDYVDNILLCEKRLEAEKIKLNEATNTLRYLKSSEKMIDYLSKIEELALIKLKNKIKDQTNQKLARIIQTEKIHVEQIDRHLVLRDKTGTSVGQSLAIAYSYLGSLFHESSHHLPFIVDSPAGALDLGVRREVSKILPQLFEQIIIFITSGEREGFTEYFYELGSNVQFLTINKQSNSEIICLEGINHFQSFQEVIRK